MIELGQGVKQFYVACPSEFADFYITDIIVQHIGSVYCILRNVSAGDGEVQQFRFSYAFDTQFHLRSLRTFQCAHG